MLNVDQEEIVEEMISIADDWALQAWQIWARNPEDREKEVQAQLLTMWANGIHRAVSQLRKAHE